jgi:putative solute:sodium symporter small subunit
MEDWVLGFFEDFRRPQYRGLPGHTASYRIGAPLVVDTSHMDTRAAQKLLIARYWRTNLRIMACLLVVWAMAGIGAGILFADYLNAFMIPGTGFPLGFWFAHQGSIAVFVLLILTYCILMNRLDRQHHKELQALENGDND